MKYIVTKVSCISPTCGHEWPDVYSKDAVALQCPECRTKRRVPEKNELKRVGV
jgi:hypothetical protein